MLGTGDAQEGVTSEHGTEQGSCIKPNGMSQLGESEKSSRNISFLRQSAHWHEVETIEDSLEDVTADSGGVHRSVIERYYTARFCLKVGGLPHNDYQVLIHSNRVCLVSLAPSHFLVAERRRIEGVDFSPESGSGGVDRLANCVSGKRKRGAQKLNARAPLATAITSDGERIVVHSPISGKLLEVNRRLLDEPQLLVNDLTGLGYLALVLPDIQVADYYRQHLLSLEQYQEQVCRNGDNTEIEVTGH